MMRFSLVLGFVMALCPLCIPSGSAQTPQRSQHSKTQGFSHPVERQKANENLLMLLGGTLGGPYLQLAQDIASAVTEKDTLRVLPIAGEGAVGNVRDILLVRGVDLGITSIQVLNAIRQSGEYGPNLERRISYIAQLSTDTLHVLARQEYNSLKDLDRKKVNVLQEGSGTSTFGPKILKALGIVAEEMHLTHNDGAQMMRAGKLDATLCICPIPVPAFGVLKNDSGFKFLEVPYVPAFEESYLPAKLTSSHYNNLIPEGSSVQTIGTSTVLITYNWSPGTEQYRKLEKFVNAFFTNMDRLRQPPHHPVWKDVNIGASIRGWQRFPAAQQWLDRQAVEAVAKAPPKGIDVDQARALATKAVPNDPAEQERLFKEFLEWSRNKGR
jgi:TRAP-type uncharacterized transport system substrate-binding protein